MNEESSCFHNHRKVGEQRISDLVSTKLWKQEG
jgi:hypothetical protein